MHHSSWPALFVPCRVLVHLSRCNVDATMFAPDKPQLHVVDHLTGEPAVHETRWRLHTYTTYSGDRVCVHVLLRHNVGVCWWRVLVLLEEVFRPCLN